MSEPKIYLTEDEDGKPGKRIEAFSLEEADAIAKSWRRRMLVPRTFKVIGELMDETDLGE